MQAFLMKKYDNLLKLKELLDFSSLPEDNYKHHYFLTPLEVSSLNAKGAFDRLVEGYVEDSNSKKRGQQQLAEFRWHWACIICGLAQVVFMRSWLIVTLDKNEYGNKGDFWLGHYGFSYQNLKDIITYLEKEDLVFVKIGKSYLDGSSRTRVYPKPALAASIWAFFLDIEQEIKPPYITIKKPAKGWRRVINRMGKDHPEKNDMYIINEYLKGSSWACKAPVRLAYKYDAYHSGRLITPFQSLPDRSIRLRINTLLNGQPLCEVDFNANHLRLNLAVLAKDAAGDTPYEDIVELAGMDVSNPVSRNIVKMFITIAMGASDENSAMYAFVKEGYSKKRFISIKKATYVRYPKVMLFNGWGVMAQSLEGEILRKVMVEGVKLGIASLPVHDALAVNHQHADWAQEAMARVWADMVGGVGTKLKVDYPS